ncbi:MAG: hypothetical protein DSZ09_04875 [Sulfurovum sp.]|nr:MAG: hypothetical protein DSZ09_04875 [Sulfurovum sp.]
MYLIYTDETGTNFSSNVSPFLLYGGLVVHESKVNNLELQLQMMIAKFLKLGDIKKVELHTSEIFQIIFTENFECKKRKSKDQKNCEELQKILSNVTVEDFISFTDELIQFLHKMDVPLIVSVVNKEDEIHKNHHLNKEVSALAYSFKMFLNILDRFLASKNEKGLLIADDFSNQIPAKIRTLSLYERIANDNIGKQKELIFLRVLYESLDWKSNSYDFTSKCIAPMKYEFESKNMFLIDNINYTNSKDSVLNQVSDFILYILRKTLECQENDAPPDNLEKLVKNIKDSILLSESENKIISGKLVGTLNSELDVLFSESFYNEDMRKRV